MKKLLIGLFSLLVLFFIGCGGGGASSDGGTEPVGLGVIDVETISPVLDEVTNPETEETIYITSAEEVYIAGKIHRLTNVYYEACSEVDNLEPLSLTGTWRNLTTGASGDLHLMWFTIYSSYWVSCEPIFNTNVNLEIGSNTIELFVENKDGDFGQKELLFDRE